MYQRIQQQRKTDVYSVIVYIIPMAVMIICHFKISKTLIENEKAISNNLLDETRLNEHWKIEHVIQLLLILTTTFFVLWISFIFIKIIHHAGVKTSPILDKFSNLCVFSSTVNNFINYNLKRKDFHESFKILTFFERYARKKSS